MIALAELDGLDRSALAALWSELFGRPVPPKMSQPMQRRFLAFTLQARAHGGLPPTLTLQARAHGGLPPALAARLDRIAAGAERKASPALRPGARLLREWNGTTHVVDVTAEGFLWNGRHHRSLSAIARAITGARWSGPRFFGLSADVPTGTGSSRRRAA